MQILHCIDRYLSSRNGDVKKLRPPLAGFRLRCGDYRVFFELKDESSIEITGVQSFFLHNHPIEGLVYHPCAAE